MICPTEWAGPSEKETTQIPHQNWCTLSPTGHRPGPTHREGISKRLPAELRNGMQSEWFPSREAFCHYQRSKASLDPCRCKNCPQPGSRIQEVMATHSESGAPRSSSESTWEREIRELGFPSSKSDIVSYYSRTAFWKHIPTESM